MSKTYIFNLENDLYDPNSFEPSPIGSPNTLLITQFTPNINDYTILPIKERLGFINQLKLENYNIIIWTKRKRDHLTEQNIKDQLEEWKVPYNQLLFNEPVYKENAQWFIDKTRISKKQPQEQVPKGWGKEIIFVNNDEYCGKLLCFDKGKRFSLHYHILKKETWYVSKGFFLLIWIDTAVGATHQEYLTVGDVITNEKGQPHQLIALEDSEIFEVSTKHADEDSYRIYKGN